jgi:hypothetical protein
MFGPWRVNGRACAKLDEDHKKYGADHKVQHLFLPVSLWHDASDLSGTHHLPFAGGDAE